MPNRKDGPPIYDIEDLATPPWKSTVLPNGTKLIEVNMGTQELVSLEIIHFASRKQEDKKGVARATARLLREGTETLASAEISEQIDYLGASMSTGANLDFSFIKLLSLTRYFEQLVPVVQSVRYAPTFPQEELDRYVANSLQKLAMDEAKVELRSYKSITEALYGSDHIYGYNSDETIYKSLTRADLVAHFEKYYGSDNCLIVLSGKITKTIREATIAAFGQVHQHVDIKPYLRPTVQLGPTRIKLPAADKSQTGLKIGSKLWNRNHEDFAGVFVLNTVLGGYFGSRLMSNIREEKGYTYSIYSGLDMMIDDGYFFVSTEVATEYVDDTIAATYAEIDRLKTELLEEEELNMIKNYLRGNFLNMVDGPFKVAALVKLIEVNKLPTDFFSRLSKYVREVTAEDIRVFANKYLDKEKMVEVLVG